MKFQGKAKPINAGNLTRIGKEIKVSRNEIQAILDMETSGSGFDSKGRPKMLFEPHIFYRELSSEERDQAILQGLAYAKWGEQPYPKDSYPKLERAMDINENIALRSASWGLGQVMGFNHKVVGYSSARDMVAAFLDDEETQLKAMIKFIAWRGLDTKLRGHDWRGFARGYNGPQYAKYNYHLKLEEAFNEASKAEYPTNRSFHNPERNRPFTKRLSDTYAAFFNNKDLDA